MCGLYVGGFLLPTLLGRVLGRQRGGPRAVPPSPLCALYMPKYTRDKIKVEISPCFLSALCITGAPPGAETRVGAGCRH